MGIRQTDKERLLFSFVLIIGLFVSTGALTLYGLFTIGQYTETIYLHPLVVSNASLRAALHMTKMHRDMKDVVLSENSRAARVALDRVRHSEQKVYRQLDLVRDNILGDAGKALERETRHLVDEWAPIRADVVRLMKAGDTAQAIHITQHRGARHVADLENKMLELTTYARTKATGFRQSARGYQAIIEKVTIIITSVAVLFSVLIAMLATRRVTMVHGVLNSERNRLEKALAEIKTLRGIIPMCSNCRQIRDDEGVWKALEQYLDEYSDASVSHGICPDCMVKLYPDIAEQVNLKVTKAQHL